MLQPILIPSLLVAPSPSRTPARPPVTELPDRVWRRPAPTPPTTGRNRLHAIDLLRGAVMVLMTLDHVRDFFGAGALNSRDVHEPALFFTRWVTHFCAPVFILLAGLSAWMYGRRPGRSTADLSRFVLARGAWLVLLEVTIVNFGWTFDPALEFVTLQVIWAIGVSMGVLAALVWLPRPAILGVALAMILCHNLLDGVHADRFGDLSWLWTTLHEPGYLPVAARKVFVLYPLVPWAGVMAAGYALGPAMELDPSRRRHLLASLGVGLVLLFVLLRGTSIYGDPAAAIAYDDAGASVLSMLNCEKYPPSLCYLAVTLGPALAALAFADTVRGRVADALVAFGRGPLFYYVAHVYLIHALALAAAWVTDGHVGWLVGNVPPLKKPPSFGFGLPVVYAISVIVVAALYPASRWFASLKQRRRDRWLSYL